MTKPPRRQTRKTEQEAGAPLAPLLLLPLRLEYRHIRKGERLRRLTHEVDFKEVVAAREKIAATAVTDPDAAEKMRQNLAAVIAKQGGGAGRSFGWVW